MATMTPALLRPARPWCPLESTSDPHTHLWRRTRGAPRRRPTATRNSLLPRRRPRLLLGMACSQAPEPKAREARRRARLTGSACKRRSPEIAELRDILYSLNIIYTNSLLQYY